MKQLYRPSILILLIIILAINIVNLVILKQTSQIHAQNSPTGSEETKIGKFSGTNQNYKIGMYSWEDEPYRMKTRAELYATLEGLEITELYQSFTEENLFSEDTRTLVPELQNMGIDLYYLTGRREWGIDPSAGSMIDEINKVSAFNKALPLSENGAAFDGILFDVEPYLTDEWDQNESAVMKSYVKAMMNAYKYAKNKKLKVIINIPNWYDNNYPRELETLIAKACDEAAVMNYNRKDEKGSIETEVELAKKYNKTIQCIMEFQQEGMHGLTSNETYYSQGLAAAKKNFDQLYRSFQYNGLKFAYHYYLPVRELMLKK